ncbi:hypothetical protein J5N97_010230 [Dioscorea zingiberensis]|uniref:Uncharacterized protein n=1 Tax=Dioscorea zingiberensis TaxID=325984 RepID=A0A9D5HM89_9LILI|nr:hypothetical protein J5N97_010230 [Dioscorea zingiberensis]
MAPLLLLLLLLTTITLSSLFIFLSLSGEKPKKKNGGNKDQLPLPPGPKGWPIVGNLHQMGPMAHRTLHRFSKTYGPLFRIRLGTVELMVASSASVATQFLKIHDANFSGRPPTTGSVNLAYNYHDLIFGPRWAAFRRLITPYLFSNKAMEDLRPTREEEVKFMVKGLVQVHEERGMIDLHDVVNTCMTNTLARVLLGRRMFEKLEGEAGEFKEMILEVMRLGGEFPIGDSFPWLAWMDSFSVVPKMKAVHRRYDVFIEKIIAEHQEKAGGGGGGDLLSVLMGMKGDEEGGKLSYTNIKALLMNLFTAGTDTTSSAIVWAMSEVIHRPDIHAKVREEIDAVVGKHRLVSEHDLPKLPLLNAIAKETLRLHPSAPLSVPHTAAEACNIQGYHIPKNSWLFVNLWAIARDPAIWANPFEFKPERFLPGGEQAHMDVKGNDFEVIPFGAGRRICVGMSMGFRMVQFMTASMLHAFDWVLPDGLEPEKLDMEEGYAMSLQRATPLKVHPVPRLTEEAYMY